MKLAKLSKILPFLGVWALFLVMVPLTSGQDDWLLGKVTKSKYLIGGQEYTWKVEVRDNYSHFFWFWGPDVQVWLAGPFTRDYRDIPGKSRIWTGVRNKPWQNKDNFNDINLNGEFVERSGTRGSQGYYLLKARPFNSGMVYVKHIPVSM